jgi:hypothetical protein
MTDDIFKVMYRVLKFLQAAILAEEFPANQFNADTFKTNEATFVYVLEQLAKEGYISGITFVPILGLTSRQIKFIRPEITIKGNEYLAENAVMKKVADVLKGAASTISGFLP